MTSCVDCHQVKDRDNGNHHVLMMFELRSRSEELGVKDASCVDAHQVQVEGNHRVSMMFKMRR